MENTPKTPPPPPPPHVLIFPLPLQGPVNSMLKLSHLFLLTAPNLHITFLLTHHIHRLLSLHTDLTSRFNHYPSFRLKTISDGLPDHHPRSGDRYLELLESLKTNTKVLFKEMLLEVEKVTCVIADGIMSFACDVCEDVGVPVLYVRTISACYLWIDFCLPKLIEQGEIPFKDDDLDVPIRSIPGMESVLRRRDLPSFCRSGNLTDPNLQAYIREGVEVPRAHGLILNTFDDLEGPIVSQLCTKCPNIYTIGPLHSHLKYKLANETMAYKSSSNSLWKEDRSCITWLDSQPEKSVIYVSYGSIATITKAQQMEFWHGLVQSGVHFLWVIRPDSLTDPSKDEEIPEELLQGTKERGYIVGWAPQEEVLAHKAVGGFLTHNGWNSTLESVIEGVPMISWPYFLDQQVNGRFMAAVWKLGLDMKDTCDRVVVEKMVRDLMVERRDEFRKSADRMAELARKSLMEGGSSHRNLERLIEDIHAMSASH